MTPVWAADLATHFWRHAGPPPAFPRDLTFAAVTYGLSLVSRPGLTLDTVRGYLARFSLPVAADVPDRRLRACLYARRAVRVVFLDAADPEDEQRFSLAHELAHFLRDVDAPRRQAGAVGAEAVRVLDGERSATADERLAATLRVVSLAPHLHLLSRDDAGQPLTPAEREAEAAADRLAGELLAPADHFAADAADEIRRRLAAEFGLPPGPAADYTRTLRPTVPRDPLLDRLGIFG